MPDDERYEVRELETELRWLGLDEIPFVFVNQLLAQVNQGEVFLTFGQVNPPVILGTPEEQEKQVRGIESVPVRTVARVNMTAERLADVVAVLTETLARHEAQRRAAAKREAESDK